jgi:hypothetical protein
MAIQIIKFIHTLNKDMDRAVSEFPRDARTVETLRAARNIVAARALYEKPYMRDDIENFAEGNDNFSFYLFLLGIFLLLTVHWTALIPVFGFFLGLKNLRSRAERVMNDFPQQPKKNMLPQELKPFWSATEKRGIDAVLTDMYERMGMEKAAVGLAFIRAAEHDHELIETHQASELVGQLREVASSIPARYIG